MYVEQTAFPVGLGSWLVPSAPDFTGYTAPPRDVPALGDLAGNDVLVSVIGTVRDEAVPLERSLAIWSRQHVPGWLHGRVELLVLDDGSTDEPAESIVRHVDACVRNGIAIRYVQIRSPGGPQRSCTLAFNASTRIASGRVLLFQWWDRIPSSFGHLGALVTPHRVRGGIVTSAISRHIGGSSSVESMTPEALAGTLGIVPWRNDPRTLERIAGPIGGHCKPGVATESSGLCIPRAEFEALGGYDVRYTTRAGYANVELWRRILQSGLVSLSPQVVGENFHQSHACPTNRAKDHGQLHDPLVRRNGTMPWWDLTVVAASATN